MTEPAPEAHGSTGDAAKELNESLKGMEASLSKIAELAKEMRNAFRDASSAVNSVSARGATGGGAGNTGAGKPTAMSNSLGGISGAQTSSAMSNAAAGAAAGMGRAAAAGGGIGGIAKAGIGGLFKGAGPAAVASAIVTPIFNAVGTMHNLGRMETERAMEIEWMRTRGARAGSDWDKIYNANVNRYNIGLDAGAAQQAVGAYQSMGYDRAGSGVNLGEAMTIGNLTGQSPLEALQTATAHRKPGQIYALQSMGIQVMNPDGSTRGQADLANQLFDRAYGGQDISLEDIKTSFDPQIGYITKMLESAGMDQTQIEAMRHLMESRVTTGAPVTQATLDDYNRTTMGEGRTAAMRAEEATGRAEKTFADAHIDAFADAATAVAGLKNALVDEGVLKGLHDFGTYLAVANETFRDYGFTPGQAAAATAGVGGSRVVRGGGTAPGNAEGDWNISMDQVSKVHQGEMVLPARIATAVRSELGVGQVGNHTGPSKSSTPANVTINVSVQRASDAEAIAFARRVKTVLSGDAEMSSLGLGQVVT